MNLPSNTDYHIILFASMKGGSGRTIAAANVAYLLARAGSRVLLIDGDVEAPGLSLMSAFRPAEDFRDYFGKGIVDLAEYYVKNCTGEKDCEIPIQEFIHPVLLGPTEFGAPPRMNQFFRDKSSLGSAAAQRGLRDFPMSGELWLMPAYGDILDAPLQWDDLDSAVAHMFAGHHRKPDDPSQQVIWMLQELVRRIAKHDTNIGGSTKGGPFDYILVDTRSGLDPWTLYVLLPMAGQIALAAQLNEQGSRETFKFLKKIHSQKFKNQVGFKRTPPITWFSQILPAGENYLRHERLEAFTKGLQRVSKEIAEEFGGEDGGLPGLVDEKDIVKIFYNSSLPLQEDIVTIEEDPEQYPAAPYWRLTDKLLKAHHQDSVHLESSLFHTLDEKGREHFADHAIEKFAHDDFATILEKELLPPLQRLSYYAPTICQTYLQRLTTRNLFMEHLIGFCEDEKESRHRQIAETYFGFLHRLPHRTQATLFLSLVLKSATNYGNANIDGKGSVCYVEEERVIDVERDAAYIHVATRR
ncbi:MAG: AAA family ATPase, partial [Gammaproteobacteria bacterium]|nr:AAA family ATPase [Gammaproteobacteria bacterium]NNJ84206.1 AAA family ATPase [Gammaproteobacteria bacterium]